MLWRRPVRSFVIGFLIPVAVAAVGGAIFGWNCDKDVGDSFNVWFRPRVGTAFFYAGLCGVGFGAIPGLFLGAGLTADQYWKHYSQFTRTPGQ
jgi:hypothetical protein